MRLQGHHLGCLAECSTLGWIIIGAVGDENSRADADARPRAEIHAEMKDVIRVFLKGALSMDGEGQ